MRPRIVIGIVAAILAIAGVGLLIVYASGADARAIAKQAPTKVLVVTRDVPTGTAASALGPFVQTKEVPLSAVVPGSVSDVSQLRPDDVASANLKVGEQVLAARFVAPNSDEITEQVPVPAKLQELSIQLEPQRVLGARLKAGDTVGIFVSLRVDAVDGKGAVAQSKLIADKILVLRAQGAAASGTASGSTDAKAPTSDVVITLAVDTKTAERIVFATEFGKVYLSRQKATSDTGGSEMIDAGNLYKP